MTDQTSEPPRQPDSSHGTAVFVAGDDLAGLSTGLALNQRGHDATVFGPTRTGRATTADTQEERAAVSGVVVDASIRRFLDEYVDDDETPPATTASEYRYLDPGGALESSFGADLELSADDALRARLRDALPADRHEPGRRIERWERRTSHESAGSEVRVVDSSGEHHHGHLLVAADGWLSQIRQRVLPSVVPTYAGYVSWHGTIDEADVPRDLTRQFADALTVSRGERDLLAGMVLPGEDGSTEPGDRRLHWVWYTPVADRELGSVLTDREETNRDTAVPPGMLQDRYAAALQERAAEHAPQFTRLVRATRAPGVAPVVDLEVPRAVVGRTAFVGDAAFTTRHHTAASTPKAIRDASTLADALDRYDDLERALDDWSSTQELHGRQLVAQGRQTDLDGLVGRV